MRRREGNNFVSKPEAKRYLDTLQRNQNKNSHGSLAFTQFMDTIDLKIATVLKFDRKDTTNEIMNVIKIYYGRQ